MSKPRAAASRLHMSQRAVIGLAYVPEPGRKIARLLVSMYRGRNVTIFFVESEMAPEAWKGESYQTLTLLIFSCLIALSLPGRVSSRASAIFNFCFPSLEPYPSPVTTTSRTKTTITVTFIVSAPPFYPPSHYQFAAFKDQAECGGICIRPAPRPWSHCRAPKTPQHSVKPRATCSARLGPCDNHQDMDQPRPSRHAALPSTTWHEKVLHVR